jgi:phosphoribosylformylglycinamidine cyclo-ligase
LGRIRQSYPRFSFDFETFNSQLFYHDDMAKLNYRSAGLNLDLYEEGISEIAPLARRTHSDRVLDGFGGFASLYSLEHDQPVLVTCTDGVGTKIHVAVQMGKHDTVGIDLVAMSVNDALCCGAQPLLFLDYVVMAEDNPELLRTIVEGISEGCLRAGCSLVGGETAIHPGDLKRGHYDLAGFCVGVVEKEQIITGAAIQPGDVIVGLASSGLHSNGYSLARKIVFDHARLGVDDSIPELGKTVGEALLEPTIVYVKPIHAILRAYGGQVHGMAHITGGGLVDNLPRILPQNCQAILRRGTWPLPPVIPWLQKLGEVEQAEMDRVFNGGIGFAVVAPSPSAAGIVEALNREGVSAYVIGEIKEGAGGVAIL